MAKCTIRNAIYHMDFKEGCTFFSVHIFLYVFVSLFTFKMYYSAKIITREMRKRITVSRCLFHSGTDQVFLKADNTLYHRVLQRKIFYVKSKSRFGFKLKYKLKNKFI